MARQAQVDGRVRSKFVRGGCGGRKKEDMLLLVRRRKDDVVEHLGDVSEVGLRRFLVKMFPATLGIFWRSLFSVCDEVCR